jgi:TPR repeat protein
MSQLPEFFIRYEVASDADQRSVKRAYAKVLKTIDQETQAQAFQELRDLYEEALRWIQYRDWQIEQERLQAIEDEAKLADNDRQELEYRVQTQDEIKHDEHASTSNPRHSDTIEVNNAEQLERSSDLPPSAENAIQDPVDPNLTASSQITEPEAYLPAVLANEVFAELGHAFANAAPKQEVALLNACLDDERLIDLEARDIFEWFVIRHIAQGWSHPNGDLFHAAVEVFGWDKDSSRLQRFDEPGQIVDRALTEYAIFQQMDVNTQKKQIELNCRLRNSEIPKKSYLKDNMMMLNFMMENYPTWIALNVSREYLQAWQQASEKLKLRPFIEHTEQEESALKKFISSPAKVFFSLYIIFILCSILFKDDDRKNSTQQAASINQYTLNQQAEIYFTGQLNFPKDTKKSIALWEKSASQNNNEAQLRLAQLYIEGKHVQQNLEKAEKLLINSGENGNVQAQSLLAEYYFSGKHVEKNFERSFYWQTQAAKQGDGIAQYNLGVLYENGFGVTKSNHDAYIWWDRAAQKEIGPALSALGFLHLHGKYGVKKDEAKALELLKKGAEKKDKLGMRILGLIYANGLAQQAVDENLAIQWLSQGKEMGDKISSEQLTKLCKKSKNKLCLQSQKSAS